MPPADLIALLQRNDPNARKQLFEQFYGRLAAIAGRYAKNQAQAGDMLNTALNNCIEKLKQNRQVKLADLDQYLITEFIMECIAFVKSIRSEYYVSSTVYAVENAKKNYDLFDNNEVIDFNHVDTAVLVGAIQKLAPAQRLIFNLHVIDGYSLPEAAALLEASGETVKSNLEKSRYNLQKNIEHSLNSVKL